MSRKYFNAGVLLINMDEWRKNHHGDCLRSFAATFGDDVSLKYSNQDVLNIVLAGHWRELPYIFNVQGMGTYGDCRDCRVEGEHNRPQLYTPTQWQKIQKHAVIVHFTGAHQPTIADLVCRHTKAPLKPFAWFCHHPLKQEFWHGLRRTPFCTWKPTVEDELVDIIARAFRQVVNDVTHGASLSPRVVQRALKMCIDD